MGEPRPNSRQLRLWHLGFLVLFVAIAATNIRDQRMTDPRLVGLACLGFFVYLVIVVAGWFWVLRRTQQGQGLSPPPPTLLGHDRNALILYFVGVASLFLVATVVYLTLERLYLGY